MTFRSFGLLLLVALGCAACTGTTTASAPPSAHAVASSPSQAPTPSPSPSPSPTPTQEPSPSPTAAPPAPAPPAPPPPPAAMDVAFSGLPPGTYPTHLHSLCSGRQAFHITVLNSLRVGPNGAGAVSVPTSYFGRGLCVIVYANTSLTSVLAFRSI